jgi:4-hydroxy-2-oxoheptanedioate aldolase
MTSHAFREALRAGKRLYGTMIVSPSPRWPQVVAGLGLDFVFIDTEHIALDRSQVSWMCQAYTALGLNPVVRILSPDPYGACAALDGGAGGVVFPYVETPAQVQDLRGATRLRPLKGDRLAAALRDESALEPALRAYLEERNRGTACIINVESVPAMERLDEMLAVPGLDGALIGPHDLSCSLGIPEQYDHPRFEEAVLAIIRRVRARGLGIGIHWWGDPARFAPWIQAGLNVIICSTDITAMQQKITADIGALRARFGDARTGGPGADDAI